MIEQIKSIINANPIIRVMIGNGFVFEITESAEGIKLSVMKKLGNGTRIGDSMIIPSDLFLLKDVPDRINGEVYKLCERVKNRELSEVGVIKYVVGFAFSSDKNHVALILKNKPEWQKGKFNGIGGKISEADDRPVDAMRREFREESGVDIPTYAWNNFAVLVFKSCILYCFRCFTDDIRQCKTMESEEVCIRRVEAALKDNIIPNLKVLIPMALDEEFLHANIQCILKGEG